jgi:hypothetical protein
MTYKKDIYLTLASFLLIVCMALPSIMKLSHAIHGHQSQKCSEDISLHIHKAEFDCEFQKFKLSKQLYTELSHFEVLEFTAIRTNPSEPYSFLISYEQLPFSLRGPPDTI